MDHRKKIKVSRMKSFVDLEGEGRDRRAERALRRSIDRREQRQQQKNKHRNFSSEDSDLPPIEEDSFEPSPVKEQKPLKERLKQWQQARDARKRREKELQEKKPDFKVSHASRDILSFNKPLKKLADVKNVRPGPERKATVPAKRSTAHEKDKPAASRRVTRSQSEPKKETEAKPAASKSKPTSTTTTGNRQTRAATTKQQPAPQAATRATRSKNVPVEPKGRVTRAKNNAVAAKKSTAVAKKIDPDKNRFTCVNQERGSVMPSLNSASFAPQDFTFNAPSTLGGYAFRPLSPATTASFLFPAETTEVAANKRCSTPTIADRTGGPVIHSPALSTIESSERKPSSAPVLNLSSALRNVSSPILVKRRRSTRNAPVNTDTDSEAEAPARKSRRSHRRSSRRSNARGSTTDSDEESRKGRCRSKALEEIPEKMDQEDQVTEPRSQKKRKRSSIQPDVQTELKTGVTPKVQSSQNFSKSEASDTGASSSKTTRRRSTRRSLLMQDDPVSSAKESEAESDGGNIVEAHALYTLPEVADVAVRNERRRTLRNTASSETTGNYVCTVQDSTVSTTTSPMEEAEKTKNETAKPLKSELNVQPPIDQEATQSKDSNTPNPVSASDRVFRTPSSTARKARRKTVHESVTRTHSNSTRKTPKHRNSLMMKAMSPEERIDFMCNSPMVEMSRRTPKQTVPEIVALPDFEELEHEVSSYSSQSEIHTATESEHEEHGNSSKSFTDKSSNVMTVTETVPTGQKDAAPSDPFLATNGEAPASDSCVKSSGQPVIDQLAENTSEVPASQITEMKPPDKPMEKNEETHAKVEHDVPYFRSLISSERTRLGHLCEHWEALNIADIPEEASGEIRTTIGKAQLLMNQRFKQFEGLVNNCEFGLGEKATHCSDLQGFWDMIYFQVEDVDAMFAELEKLQKRSWQSDKPPPKKVVQKKVIKPSTKNKKPAGVKSGFAAFRAKMAAQKKEEESAATISTPVKEASITISPAKPLTPKAIPSQDDPEENKENIAPEQKVFDAGFFNISSPIKEPEFHCKAGSPKKTSNPASLRNSPVAPILSASPMLKAVLKKSARKSMSVDPKMRRSSHSRRGSWAMGDGPASHSKAALVSLKLSPMAKVTPSSLKTTQDSPMSVVRNEGSPNVRRSLRIRRSTSHRSTEETSMETGTDFSKFLMPSVQESTTKDEVMELDLFTTPVNDVEMSARTKRTLTKEFNKENASLTARLDDSLSVSTQSCRSVHFSIHSPPLAEQVHKLPSTPFNKDSLVPRARIASGEPAKEVDNLLMMTPDGPGVQSSYSEESEDDSPSTKFSKLRVNYTPGPQCKTMSKTSVDALLFTPPVQGSPLKEKNLKDEEVSPTMDLIMFTPASDKSTDDTTTPARKSALKSSSKRRSVRIKNNNVSFL